MKHQNVVYPINCEESNDIVVLSAHTDTVFSDIEPMTLKEDDEKIYCPGVGDDTASVAVLLMVAKYYIQKQIVPQKGILFVCNSCEEGLGNLKGTRRLMQEYAGRIARFIALDSKIQIINDRCVGSHRYQVSVMAQGGHSFNEFGKSNAIAVLSKIVNSIYELQVPQVMNSRTSYNVGIIEGGTSVNAIAQHAQMLCEYRSDSKEALDIMKRKFETIFASAHAKDIEVSVIRIGERPCAGDVDVIKEKELIDICKQTIEDVTGESIALKPASTDCNIPLSLGIPSVCIGVFHGDGAHTREEWVEKASLRKGLEIAIKIANSIAS